MSKAFLQFAKESKKPQVEQKEWMKEKVMELVTPETISRVIQECIDAGLYALDLETTGLDTRVFNNRTKDQIVGACLSPDGIRGYYIPVRHRGEAAKHNIAVSLFEEEMRRLVASPSIAIFHNGKFDQEFLQFCGGDPIGEWDNPKAWEDTLILAYLRNTRERRKGLKALSMVELQCEMIELKELFPPDTKNFDYSELDPSWDAVVWYAASDAICTYNLFKVLHSQVVGADAKPNQATVYQIEKMDCAAVRWMERNRVHVDQDKVAELIRLGQEELYHSIKDVYDFCSEHLGRDVAPAWWHVLSEGVKFVDEDGGQSKEPIAPIFNADDIEQDINTQIEESKKVVAHNSKRPAWDQSVELNDIALCAKRKLEKTLSNGDVFEFPHQYDIMSAKQLGPLMVEMEVPDLRRTEKSKQVMTTAAEMDRLTELHGDTFPFMAKIKRFREVQKGLSTFLFPLRLRSKGGDADDSDSTIKINYNAWKVDTGRFATPGSRRPEIDGGTSYNMHSTPAGYDPKKPACVRRLRECISVRDSNKLLAAVDFSGVELRIVTNLSREPKWLVEYFRCSACEYTFDKGNGKQTPEAPPPFCPRCGSDKIGDLHTLSAISFYGEDSQKDKKQFKQYRQKSKCVHPDTLTLTPKGLQTLASFSYGEPDSFRKIKELEVWNGKKYVRALETYNGGRKKLYHVVTRRGIITCSDEHKFLTKSGDLVSISSGLKEGLLLADIPDTPTPKFQGWAKLPHQPHKHLPKMLVPTNEKLAYFAGVFLGNGAKHGKNSVSVVHGHISKVDKLGMPYAEWQDILAEAITEAGLHPVKYKKRIGLGSRHVMRFLGSLELLTGGDEGSRNLRIPSWVLKAGKTGLMHFFGGLFDTDGTVNLGDSALSCTTKDPIFAGQIAAALHSIGVLPYVEPCWNKTYRRWYYRVRIRGFEAAKFRKYLRHWGKTQRIKKRGFRTPKPNMVTKVIPAHKQECVDLHLNSKDHLYWTNGILTHNSVNFALCYGGSGKAVTRTINCDDNEGWRIYRQFSDTYKGLQEWWKKQHTFAKANGYVLTAFGRKYPVPDILLPKYEKDPVTKLRKDNGAFIAKAERNSVNGPIQACLHYDSRIQTSLGLLPVGDLWERQSSGEFQGFSVWTGKKWQEGRAIFSGEKHLIRTTLGDGRVLKTSPEHLFRCWKGRASQEQSWHEGFEWVEQKNLQLADSTAPSWVAVNAEQEVEYPEPAYSWEHTVVPQTDHKFTAGMTPHNAKPFNFEGNSELLWEFLGLIYGDGSIMENALILHVGDSKFLNGKKFAESYAQQLNGALNVGASVYYPPDPDAYEKRYGKKPIWQVKVFNASFRAFTREVLGVEDANTYTKRVPKALWKESARNRKAFLRGLFSADGSTSETGDTVSLRGVNFELMQDSQALLHSVGIRASHTPKCDRVTVLNRPRYLEEIGYCIPHKQERLANMKINPYMGQWHLLPRDLVSWVGEVVYQSSIYSGLARPQKSAVLRLKTGSGSKPQCLKYLNSLPEKEVPSALREALKYDYEKAAKVEDTGENVTMYDIEVFDEDHAFVCDGTVVHNTSADITKLAMALVYKECKKRGWLKKVLMTITIHDELVFEIDKDLIEEALDVILHIMTSSPPLLKLRWPIPLTLDCEIGHNWTVPWNLVEFQYAKEEWPDELKEYFPNKVAFSKKVKKALESGQEVPQEGVPSQEQSQPEPEETPKKEEHKVASTEVVHQDKRAPDLAAGELFIHRLRSPLKQGTVERLATVLHRCKNRGSHPIQVLSGDGQTVLWESPEEFTVNPTMFLLLADELGV